MILPAPLQNEIVGNDLVGTQEWLAWFDEVGEAISGVWGEIPDTPSITDATVDSVQSYCVVRGNMAYLHLTLNNYSTTSGGTYASPVTFKETFSHIRDISSGTLIGLSVDGSTVSLPKTDGSYELIINAPVVLDKKLASR